MKSKTDAKLIEKIIKRYGPVIDLRKEPEVFIDILRTVLADEPPDGGQPCGGTPLPPPPPGSRIAGEVTNEELMKAILKLTREISAIKTTLGSKTAKRR
jgi:hypothetical protein